MFLMAPVAGHAGETWADLNLLDVGPTALKLMGLPIPAEMEGKALI
jgi:bisphosphoglycerate-independent phosphoglycerate mutase (AlkP superfamily)